MMTGHPLWSKGRTKHRRGGALRNSHTGRREIDMRSVVISLSMALVIAALAPVAANARSVKQPLRATGIEASAQGVAAASIHAKANRGKFRVIGRNLKPGTTYGI